MFSLSVFEFLCVSFWCYKKAYGQAIFNFYLSFNAYRILRLELEEESKKGGGRGGGATIRSLALLSLVNICWSSTRVTHMYINTWDSCNLGKKKNMK